MTQDGPASSQMTGAMILRAYLVKTNGEPLYGRSYDKGRSSVEETVPPQVRACVTLFTSSGSTAAGQVYALKQEGMQWAYMFFKSFAIALLTSDDEDAAHLNKRMTSLGKEFATAYGELMVSWSGDMGQIEGLEALVNKYVTMNLGSPSERVSTAIEKLVDANLEAHNVAYVGVFDAAGSLVHGSVPDSHLAAIRSEISHGVIKAVADVVPNTVAIEGHEVSILRVHSFTVAVASYKDESRLKAVKAAGEIAHSIELLLDDESKSSKPRRRTRKA
ncbi:MAG: hypothetical protein C4K49_12140 [Candidatus Thorarchaeota archaeon]|nr:MAG: hypothetical protein C4K49_12140 [Candidatus Thorarchaeota archaeon]